MILGIKKNTYEKTKKNVKEDKKRHLKNNKNEKIQKKIFSFYFLKLFTIKTPIKMTD
jgi:hypothetical protein